MEAFFKNLVDVEDGKYTNSAQLMSDMELDSFSIVMVVNEMDAKFDVLTGKDLMDLDYSILSLDYLSSLSE